MRPVPGRRGLRDRFRAVRVGFVTTVSWQRFGPPWAAMVRDVGADTVLPAGDALAEAVDDSRAVAAGALLPRLVVAAAVVCGDCDLLVAPEPLTGEGGPGAAQDPWIADLPDMLARALPGAPPVVAVPAEGGPQVERLVMSLLTRVHRDAALARRAWERQRAAVVSPRATPRPAPRVLDPQGPRVALVGHPWWLSAGGIDLAGRGAGTVIGQHQFAPADLRAEGRRARADLVDPDAEAIGAARRFARQGDVDTVRLVLDPDAPTSAWLERRVREVAERKLEVVAPLELASAAEWARALTARVG
jgi:hypothetical protein